MPTVSVIIPTYNRCAALYSAVESIVKQTYEDWELIIVDDCSTDRTWEVIDHYERGRFGDKISSHRLPTNSGSPVRPRNVGVDMARGDYVAFLDSDDSWYPRKLETQVWYMDYHGSAFTYHDLFVQRRQEDVKGDLLWSRMSTCHADSVFPFLLRKNFVPTSSVMMLRDLYRRYGGMDEDLTINHDWDLWLKIAYENQIHFVNEPLGELYLHGGSVITEAHRRRSDSRRIVRKWRGKVDEGYYRRILVYYYLMEVFDVLPENIQALVRKWWYNRGKYRRE